MKMKVIVSVISLSLIMCTGILFAQEQQCKVDITKPADGELIKDSGALKKEGYFAFTVEGTVSNLGDNVLCLYQKVPGGDMWWRSGDPLTKSELGPNGKWKVTYASCDKVNSPLPECGAKAVVVKGADCPKSGANTPTISNPICESAFYTYKTK